MASGKQKREFSPGTMSLMLTPGLGDSTLIEGNFEGFASGLRLVLGTKAFVGGKQGTFSLCGAAYLDGGDGLESVPAIQGNVSRIGAFQIGRQVGVVNLS